MEKLRNRLLGTDSAFLVERMESDCCRRKYFYVSALLSNSTSERLRFGRIEVWAVLIKWLKKWSFVWSLLICGVVVLTATGSWEAVGKPLKNIKNTIRQESGENPEGGDVSGDDAGSGQKESGIAGEEGKGQKEQTDGTKPQESSPQGEQSEEAAGEQTVVRTGEGNLTPEDGSGQNADGSATNASETDVSASEITYRNPEEVVYRNVDDDYFSDAVFIGDSRTVGMYEYGGLENNTTFYASTGLTIFKLFDAKIAQIPGQRDKVTVEEALSSQTFGKIYLMVGINEMGTGNLDKFAETYKQAVEHLRTLQPNAVIYLQAIMKVTTKRSQKGDYITNQGIDERNEKISQLADNVWVYYLDVNPLICDESGGMEPTYTFDGVHLKAQYVPIWKDFLKAHAVVLPW